MDVDTIQVKYSFSNQETVDIAKEQGRHMQSMARLEEEFDSQWVSGVQGSEADDSAIVLVCSHAIWRF